MKMGIVTLSDGVHKRPLKTIPVKTRRAAPAVSKAKAKSKPAVKFTKNSTAPKDINKKALYFRKQIKEMRALVHSDEGLSEKSALTMSKVLFGAILEAVKDAERNYSEHPTPNNGYLLNNLIAQAQSMMKEINLMQTSEQRLAEIVDVAVMTGLRRLVFQMSQSFIGINAAADEYAGKKSGKIKKRTERAADAMAELAQEVAQMIRDEILKNA